MAGLLFNYTLFQKTEAMRMSAVPSRLEPQALVSEQQ